MSTQSKALFWIAIILGGSIGGYMIADYAADGQLFNIAPPVTVAGPFSITVYDGITLDELDNGDFDFTLYGTDDLTDWVAFDVIETGDSLSDISAADLADYDHYVVRYNGTMDIEDYADEDEELEVHLYERWAEIIPDVGNILYAYQTPNTVAINAFYAANWTAVTHANTIKGNTNCTFLISSNVTEKYAAYVAGKNFENEEDDYPYIRLSFNKTMTSLSNFSIEGTTRSRLNTTAFMFKFSMLGYVPQLFNGYWGPAMTRFTAISHIHFCFGDTEIDML